MGGTAPYRRLDVNALVLKLRAQSRSPETWEIIPPGYAKEMVWPP
jgi:hypothetical protein